MARADDVVGVAIGAGLAVGLAAAMALAPHGVPRLRAADEGPGWFAYAPSANWSFIVDVPVCLDRSGSAHIARAEALGAGPSTADVTDQEGRPLRSGLDVTTVCPPTTRPRPTSDHAPGSAAVQVRSTGERSSGAAPRAVRLHYVTGGENRHLDIPLPQPVPAAGPS